MSRRPHSPPCALIGPVANLTEELQTSNTAAAEGNLCSICYGDFELGEEVAYSEACERTREDDTVSRHIYHKECMEQWIRTQRDQYGPLRAVSCPACRVPITQDDMVAFGFPRAQQRAQPARGPTFNFPPAPRGEVPFWFTEEQRRAARERAREEREATLPRFGFPRLSIADIEERAARDIAQLEARILRGVPALPRYNDRSRNFGTLGRPLRFAEMPRTAPAEERELNGEHFTNEEYLFAVLDWFRGLEIRERTQPHDSLL